MPRKTKREGVSSPPPKRMRVWTHNRFFGHARMTEVNMRTIATASTTTPQAKALANHITALAWELRAALKTRIDE